MCGELERRVRALGRRGRRAVVAAVIRGEEHLCSCRFPRGRPVDRRSLFEIGSITKAFTGVLLADMVLAGEVALDDPLSRHLADRRPAWRHREPTLLELATHRSGLPNTPGPMARREFAYAAGLGARDPWAGLTAADYERLVARESPRRAPGTRFRYSSMAVGLLGDALAARAGPHARIGRHAAVGLGWMIAAPRKAPRVVWHNGGTWGFRSFAGFDPGAGNAAVVLSNTARSVDRLGFELVRES